jgi:AraC family transcriptional regulator
MSDSAPARPEWAALQHVHKVANAEVALISPQNDWDNIAATRFRFANTDVDLQALGVPAYGVNYGPDMHLQRTLHGQKTTGCGRAGHLSLLPPDEDTRWVFDRPGDVVLVFLNRAVFSRAIEEAVDRDPRSVEIIPQFVIRDLVLERVAHELLGEISNAGPGGRLRIETIAQALAAHLIKVHSNSSRTLGSGRKPYIMAPGKLKRVEEFISSKLDTDLSLQDLANAAGMSLFHFAKAFKLATGLSPYKYVKEQRLHLARTLLHDDRLSIGQVASAIGLSPSHFTAEFKHEMGMTPRKFREVLFVQ